MSLSHDRYAHVLRQLLVTAGVPITDVTLGDVTDKATWMVSPASLQGAAQPTIDALDPHDPSHEQAEQDAEVKVALDVERLISAVVWAVIDTYSAPATRTKYLAARTKIIDAYKGQPWTP